MIYFNFLIYVCMYVNIQGAFLNKFSRFLGLRICRKLARTKNQQVTEKASRQNGRTVFCRFYYWLGAYQQECCQHFLIIYSLFITLPHNLRQLPFSPPPPPQIECAAPDRVPLHHRIVHGILGSCWHAKAYDHVSLK